MLQRMREGKGAKVIKIVLMGFLTLAVGGLVLSDVGGFFRGGNLGSNVVAKGSGVKITAPEFDQTVRRVLARQNVNPAEAYQRGMIHMILNSEIQQRLISRKAHSLGLQAGDEIVTSQMAKMAQEISPQSGGSKAEALKQILRQQGISESEFIASIRQETANSVLRSALVSGAGVLPAALVQDLYKSENQTRDVEAFLLKNDTIKDFDQPTEENLQKYYDANKAQFAIPETRTVTLATLSKEMVEDRVVITDEQIKTEYDSTIDHYTKPENRRVQQAVLDDEAKAKEVVAQVKAGKTLKEAAGKAYLGEEAFQESGLMAEIGGPVFSAKVKDVVGPIQTPLGWHVMVLSAVLPPEITPLDKVKADIKAELMQSRLMDDLIAAGNEIDDRLASGEDLNALVKELGLTTQKLGPFAQNGKDASGKNLFTNYQADMVQIIDAAFSAQEGESAPIIETADGQFVVVHVDAATELAYKPFDGVKEALKKQWIGEQQSLLNKSRARDAHKRIIDGESFAAVAKDLGVSIQTFKGLKRYDKAPAALGPVAMTKLFSVADKDYILAEQEGGITIAGVTNIKFPSADKLSADQVKEQEEMLRKNQSEEMLSLFVSNLTGQSKVEINEAVLQQMYGAPVNGQ